ncbi:MAG: outer membrane beta-barrel protein [Bacteroidota bacterium]
MKKVLLFLFCIAFATSLLAQDVIKPEKQQKPGLATGVDIYNDFWRVKSSEMTPRGLNQGVDGFIVYNVPVDKTPLSFSIGTGISVHNLYSNCILQEDSNKTYYFSKIINLVPGKSTSYKRSKISVASWDFPLEFRYRNKGGLTFALGFKFGMNINSMTKYKGTDYTGMTNDNIKFKVKDLDNMVKWSYGFTARAGYKMVEFYYYYAITNIFTTNKGPEIAPMSLGISIRPMFMEGKK